MFSAEMKYDGEGAQLHFLPGTGRAHLELSAMYSVVVLHVVVMALLTSAGVFNTVYYYYY